VSELCFIAWFPPWESHCHHYFQLCKPYEGLIKINRSKPALNSNRLEQWKNQHPMDFNKIALNLWQGIRLNDHGMDLIRTSLDKNGEVHPSVCQYVESRQGTQNSLSYPRGGKSSSWIQPGCRF